MNANTQKNIDHVNKQASKVRPKTSAYNFVELEAVMRSWVKPVDEIYSPYLGAV
ncbi:hypothetical protein UFOVP71_239 [uncultured Caudovirales phage]|uniref:Uncharacterized protein n=1 Tax=uncultured Caudovirales phage TaxID=2100421 RepID=A0A6J5TAQ6_9CAUD|nr:hypothetical protein UFOVP71_239 [uncultured Caudovirales phage]